MRHKYARLISKIDNELLNQKQRKIHWYTFYGIELTKELKEVLKKEYLPHWEEVFFTSNKMGLVTKELHEFKIEPCSDIRSDAPSVCKKRHVISWPFFNYAGFNFGTSNGKKKAKS